MEEIKLIGWISWDEAEKKTENNAGGLGGWVKGQNFDDYLAEHVDTAKPYLQAIRDSVVEKGIRYTGRDHQNRLDGTPLFSDDTVSMFSYRAWGDLMAAIWNSEEPGANYEYMDFYM